MGGGGAAQQETFCSASPPGRMTPFVMQLKSNNRPASIHVRSSRHCSIGIHTEASHLGLDISCVPFIIFSEEGAQRDELYNKGARLSSVFIPTFGQLMVKSTTYYQRAS